MRNGIKFMGIAAVAALSLIAWAASDGVVLKRTGKTGDVLKYKMVSEMEAQGQPITLNALLSMKLTDVSSEGNYTIDSGMDSATIDMGGGQEMDISDQVKAARSTTVYAPNGDVISTKTTVPAGSDTNPYRMARLNSHSYPATPVNVGDTWTTEVKKDDKGSIPGKGSFKVEARETIDGHDCYRIHVSYKETIDQSPASYEGTEWIDIANRTLVKSNETWTNFPIPQLGPTNMKVTMSLAK